jgi:hypothetical protein
VLAKASEFLFDFEQKFLIFEKKHLCQKLKSSLKQTGLISLGA